MSNILMTWGALSTTLPKSDNPIAFGTWKHCKMQTIWKIQKNEWIYEWNTLFILILCSESWEARLAGLSAEKKDWVGLADCWELGIKETKKYNI